MFGIRRFNRYSRFRLNKAGLWSWFLALSVCAAAFGGAYLLGGLYIDIIREGAADRNKIIDVEDTETVNAAELAKSLVLNPVPVYYLQAGVYSSLAGAQAAAKPLEDAGYIPYITKTPPYRIWLGIYRKRADTEAVKRRLSDIGISSFTGSTVINGSDLKYERENELVIQSLAPFLELCTDWFKENLGIFDADKVEGLDWAVVQGQAAVSQEIYKSLLAMKPETSTNSEAVNRRLTDLFTSAEEFQVHLKALMQKRSQAEFAGLQAQFLLFTDNFLLLLQEIENMSKT